MVDEGDQIVQYAFHVFFGRGVVHDLPVCVQIVVPVLIGSGNTVFQALQIGEKLSCNDSERLEGDLIVANDIAMIASMAFMDCNKLTRISLPNTLTSIGSYAFAECDKLENVTIPDSVIEIGSHAFYNCV